MPKSEGVGARKRKRRPPQQQPRGTETLSLTQPILSINPFNGSLSMEIKWVVFNSLN